MATKKTPSPAKKAAAGKSPASKSQSAKGAASKASSASKAKPSKAKSAKANAGKGTGAAAKSGEGKSGKAKAAVKTAEPKKGASALAAEKLLAEGTPADVADLGAKMLGDNDAAATKSARVLSEVIVQKPEAAVSLVDRFVTGLTASNKRVVQTSADALPAIAKVAPARVAKHLDRLKAAFPEATLPGQDGLVRTFAALCSASVAYQRRLEPVLTLALRGADPKTLIVWTEGVLPALKGEPHANARAVVEERLATLPKAQAQHLADFLGVNLRHHRLR